MKLGALLSALLATLLASPAVFAGGLKIGDPAPMCDVAMNNVDGNNVTIASVRGQKGTLVVFTCNHCPMAQAWESRIATLGNTYQRRGIGVIAINSNDPTTYAVDSYAEMQNRARQRRMAFPYVVDSHSRVARAFGATRTPEAFLFDAGGKLVYHGGIDDNARHPEAVTAHWLRDALDAELAGRPIALPVTKSMGCTIMFHPGTY